MCVCVCACCASGKHCGLWFENTSTTRRSDFMVSSSNVARTRIQNERSSERFTAFFDIYIYKLFFFIIINIFIFYSYNHVINKSFTTITIACMYVILKVRALFIFFPPSRKNPYNICRYTRFYFISLASDTSTTTGCRLTCDTTYTWYI